jgi:hypothetical protein
MGKIEIKCREKCFFLNLIKNYKINKLIEGKYPKMGGFRGLE